MKPKVFATKGKIWKYPGQGGWHFVHVDKKTSETVKKEHSKKKVGFGFIPVIATLGKSSWKTSLFPTKEGVYLIAIKVAIRKKEGIYEEDKIKVSFVLL